MKLYLSIIAMTFVFSGPGSFAQEFSPNRWKETRRLNEKDKKEIAYTDTLFLTYAGGEDAGIRKGGFVYNGKFTKKTLNLGHLEFDVVSKKDDEIKLSRDGNVHVFTRVALDKSASDAHARIKENELPSTLLSSVDVNLLKGEWEAYKRVSRSGPMPQIDFRLLIKKAVFYTETQDGKIGLLYSTAKEDYLYAVNSINGGALETRTKEGQAMTIKVFQADGKEMIIEDQYGVLYYMRKF